MNIIVLNRKNLNLMSELLNQYIIDNDKNLRSFCLAIKLNSLGAAKRTCSIFHLKAISIFHSLTPSSTSDISLRKCSVF